MILHVMTIEKFIPPFIDFVTRHFDSSKHRFAFITSEKYLHGLTPKHRPEFLHTDEEFNSLKKLMDSSSKIILHGLWRDKVDAILAANVGWLKKCHWILWGADFYFPENQSENRHIVIENMGFLVTANPRDVEFVRQKYDAKGKHINCISYLSNVFYEKPNKEKNSSDIFIQVGNSAGETNEHEKVLRRLDEMKVNKARIYCPLSYGNQKYAAQIRLLGQHLFADKFHSLDDFMPFDEYIGFLSTIDIAVFNAPRQQSFGNILYLLGMGKKVFINRKSNLINYFADYNIKVYDSNDLDLSPLNTTDRETNMLNIRANFTEESLKRSLSTWIG